MLYERKIRLGVKREMISNEDYQKEVADSLHEVVMHHCLDRYKEYKEIVDKDDVVLTLSIEMFDINDEDKETLRIDTVGIDLNMLINDGYEFIVDIDEVNDQVRDLRKLSKNQAIAMFLDYTYCEQRKMWVSSKRQKKFIAEYKRKGNLNIDMKMPKYIDGDIFEDKSKSSKLVWYATEKCLSDCDSEEKTKRIHNIINNSDPLMNELIILSLMVCYKSK